MYNVVLGQCRQLKGDLGHLKSHINPHKEMANPCDDLDS